MTKFDEGIGMILKSISMLLKPRTIFAIAIYGSVIYAALWRELVPDILADAMFTLMGFYFGDRMARKIKETK